MNRKKELCRNFQRGSCQYGERCKFLHMNQQQQRPNPFGFGTGSQFQHTNQQQQRPSPFGFGVQNNSQTKGASDFGSKYQNQFKPFENKWTRSSNVPNSTLFRQADNQLQLAPHKCTDPESCKRQIVEDFQHERPLWKLTCYGHSKNHPCDIVGDISYEELRAEAYKEAKQGLSLHSIVERERSLLNSKLIEFESLLHNPYVISPHSISAGPSPFPGINSNASSVADPSSGPLVSSLSQLGTALNLGSGTWSPASPNNAFVQSNSFQVSSQNPGSFGRQQLIQPFSAAPNFSNSSISAGSNQFSSSSAMLTQFPNHANSQSPVLSNGPSFAANAVRLASVDIHSADTKKKIEVIAGDASIWLKEWNPGEIPEEEPPEQFIYL